MDEPTASLDPDIADKTLSLIEDLRRERQLSILFTSHNMDEVSRICDDVVFLDRGEVVARGTPRQLTQQIPEAELHMTCVGDLSRVAGYLDAERLAYQFGEADRVVITLHESAIPRIILALDGMGISISEIDVRKSDLEDVFIQIARRPRVG
jgi:ABC-type multidrug transport system ATPase subunit